MFSGQIHRTEPLWHQWSHAIRSRPQSVWPDGGIKSSLFFKLSQYWPQQFYFKSDIFQNSPKSYQIFGLGLYENLSPRHYPNLVTLATVTLDNRYRCTSGSTPRTFLFLSFPVSGKMDRTDPRRCRRPDPRTSSGSGCSGPRSMADPVRQKLQNSLWSDWQICKLLVKC